MIKGILTTLVLLLLCSLTTKAQWVNQGAWPDATIRQQLHAIAVDPDGKVWASSYSSIKHLPPGATDSITTRLIYVFNPDGSQASFSPIYRIIVGSETDTLVNSSRGMRADQNGNIIYTTGGQDMYRLNYQTGEGMNKVALGIGTSPTAPAVSADGKIFVGPVVNAGNPIQEYDTDFNLVGNAVEPFTESGFSRSMECSADGNTLYFPSYTRAIVLVYNRPDELSAFDSVGVIMQGAHCESITFNPVTGNLWVAGGSYNDLPDSGSGFTPGTWYEYNLATSSVVDSLKWSFNVPMSANERPRGLDFSPDGMTAYIGVFGQPSDFIQKVVNMGSSVDEEGQVVVNGYALSQNYPNPFNPSTKISFELPQSGYTTLKVYDMLGNEVVTLVQNELTSGTHSVDFNAANLASGTYVYQLNVNGVRITNKMVLLK